MRRHSHRATCASPPLSGAKCILRTITKHTIEVGGRVRWLTLLAMQGTWREGSA